MFSFCSIRSDVYYFHSLVSHFGPRSLVFFWSCIEQKYFSSPPLLPPNNGMHHAANADRLSPNEFGSLSQILIYYERTDFLQTTCQEAFGTEHDDAVATCSNLADFVRCCLRCLPFRIFNCSTGFLPLLFSSFLSFSLFRHLPFLPAPSSMIHIHVQGRRKLTFDVLESVVKNNGENR